MGPSYRKTATPCDPMTDDIDAPRKIGAGNPLPQPHLS